MRWKIPPEYTPTSRSTYCFNWSSHAAEYLVIGRHDATLNQTDITGKNNNNNKHYRLQLLYKKDDDSKSGGDGSGDGNCNCSSMSGGGP